MRFEPSSGSGMRSIANAVAIVLRHGEAPHRRLVVPDHRSLAKGTLCSLIREAGLTVEQVADLL